MVLAFIAFSNVGILKFECSFRNLNIVNVRNYYPEIRSLCSVYYLMLVYMRIRFHNDT